MEAIRILYIDEHEMMHEMMRRSFSIGECGQNEAEIEIAGTASTTGNALSAMKKGKFDIVIIKHNIDGMNGFALSRQLLAANPETKIIILTDGSAPENVRRCIDAGIQGQVSMGSPLIVLVAAIRTVQGGKKYFDPVLMISNSSHEKDNKLIEPRDLSLIRLLAQEKTKPQIARILKVTQRTVTYRQEQLRKKIGCRSNIGLVLYAQRKNLL